jgi:protein ImuB
VLWCPDFRLQSVVRRVEERHVVLVDDAKRRSVVLERSAAAARYGIEPGLGTVQALARCPRLEVQRPSADAEMATSRLLLETALEWVPGFEESEPGLLTLDLSTQREIDWVPGAEAVRCRLGAAGLEHWIGLGETPSLARIAALAARHRGESVWWLVPSDRAALLDELPLQLGEISADLRERLQLWGIGTLGQYARLDRAAVAARLGAEGVALWLRLTGRLVRPLQPARLEQLFVEQREFEYEEARQEVLALVVRELLGVLLGRVERSGRAVGAVHLILTWTGGERYARRFALPEPTLDEESLDRLINGHLGLLEMRGRVTAVLLRCEVVERVASQRTLFGKGLQDADRYAETLARLRRLVGAERVGSPRPVDSHHPGRSELVSLQPELRSGVGGERRRGPALSGPPFFRFPAPVSAEVRWAGGQPVVISSSPVSGGVIAASGPWLSQGQWWDQKQRWQRIEWDIEVDRHGLFRLLQRGADWCLEGWYG